MNVRITGLFTASIAVGAGLVIGKSIGDLFKSVSQCIVEEVIICSANKGYKASQEFCDKYNLKYSKTKKRRHRKAYYGISLLKRKKELL